MKKYLLTYADHEGRDVLSLHSRDTILSAYDDLVSNTEKVREIYELYPVCEVGDWEKYEKAVKKAGINKKYLYFYSNDVERYCVMEVDENGAKCVCKRLGLKN